MECERLAGLGGRVLKLRWFSTRSLSPPASVVTLINRCAVIAAYPVTRLLLVLPLFTLISCTKAENLRTVQILNPPDFAPSSPEEVKSLEQAIAAVITVSKEISAFPVVTSLDLHLHKDKRAFVAYFNRRQVPSDLVKLAGAIAEGKGIHIDMEQARNMSWGELVPILAHEYSHIVEYVIKGHDRSRPKWLTEGFAQWVAAQVMHALGWQDYATTLHRERQQVLNIKDSLPHLSRLDGEDWFNLAGHTKGAAATYSVAFLAVDKLVEKRGVPGIVKYFKSEDFQDSFGLLLGDFETQLRSSIAERQPIIPRSFKLQKPEWKVGYVWTYVRKRPGGEKKVVKEITREETFEGVPSYVVKIEERENFYAKDGLSLSVTISGGKLLSKRHPPSQPLVWPLAVGAEWRNSFTWENFDLKSAETFDFHRVASNLDRVTVPAGTFDAIKIDTYESDSGLLRFEYWYSPKVKWFVKTRSYNAGGLEEEELINFKLIDSRAR